jgi:hypothetical protein
VPSAQTRISVKRQQFGMYPSDSPPLPDGSPAPRLLVPHPDMWKVHEASTPESVLQRAGLSLGLWDYWRRQHFSKSPSLPDWLYGDAPRDLQGFPFTDAMHRFCESASVRAIAGDIERPKEDRWIASQPRQGNKLNANMIWHWLRTHERFDWFKGWLIRGKDPPPHVRVLTADEIVRCSAAWDYLSLLKAAKVPAGGSMYGQWFNRATAVVPSGKQRLEWLRWWYSSKGHRHAPAFVVTPKLQAYRKRGSVPAIARAAQLDRKTVKRWRRDPVTWKLVEEAVEAARQGKLEAESAEFCGLPENTRDSMMRYARKATRAARCADSDVQLLIATLDEQLRQAQARGVGQVLRDYLDRRPPYNAVRYRRQFGLIEGGLFVLPKPMDDFHAASVKEWSRQRISPLEEIPGFWHLFEAWVTPGIGRRQRTAKIRRVASGGREFQAAEAGGLNPPALPAVNDHADRKERKIRKRRRSSKSQAGVRRLVFTPTAFQVRVLDALAGKFRTADQLESDLGCDRKHLFYESRPKKDGRGLSGLVGVGLVRNDRGQNRGYYRPDEPPPQIAKFQAKNRTSETLNPTTVNSQPH